MTVAEIRAIRDELTRFYMDPDGLNRRARGQSEPIVYHDRGIEEWDAVALAHGVEEAKSQIRTFPEYLAQHPQEPPPSGTLPPLTIDGQFFRAGGQPWTAIESSEFSLYKRFLDGEDLRPVLEERRELGFNLLRVWLLNTSVIPGGLQPSQYPDFYVMLKPFADLCANFGFYVEFTAFTQTQTLMPNVKDQSVHWQLTVSGLRGVPNVLLELVNEADQHDNKTAPELLTMRPAGILASSGSNGADSPPPEPVWDYVLYHSNGLDEFQRKVGHNAWEYGEHFRVPAMSNENTRYPDQDSNVRHAFDAAAGAALLCAGSCFHSTGGKLSRLFDATESVCAAAWVGGAKSVPLEFQRGRYDRHDNLNGPDCIRAYTRTLPDGRRHLVKIRP